MTNSPRLSFKGYRFSEALFRNKDSIKGIVAVLGAYSTYLGATGFDTKAFAAALAVAGSALGVKLLADAVDFYFSEVKV
jgi:hypothetical protein